MFSVWCVLCGRRLLMSVTDLTEAFPVTISFLNSFGNIIRPHHLHLRMNHETSFSSKALNIYPTTREISRTFKVPTWLAQVFMQKSGIVWKISFRFTTNALASPHNRSSSQESGRSLHEEDNLRLRGFFFFFSERKQEKNNAWYIPAANRPLILN